MINILFLYPDLLNLYGDHANVSAVEKYLKQSGVKVNVERLESGSPTDLSKYHMIYVGSGTENSLDRALNMLMPVKDQLKEFVDSGRFLLATGTAAELFGKCIEDDRDTAEALGILPFGVRRDKKRRILQDCLFDCSLFNKKTIGFVNRCSQFFDVENPLFEVIFGIGHQKGSKSEGFIYKNLMATTLVGPLLVRNPHVLEFVAGRLTEISKDTPTSKADVELAVKAYEAALVELEKRALSK